MSLQDNQIGQGEAFHFMALFLAMAKTRAISVLRMPYRKSCIMLFPLQKVCLMRSVFCPREALLYVVLVVLVVFPPHQVASKQHKQPYHSIFRMNQKKMLMVLFLAFFSYICTSLFLRALYNRPRRILLCHGWRT